ncbi:MAG: glutamine--tRNA ligase/YqeY domain fusion protein [Thermoguttaceae bacterium]|jgi:glutaminyl-tRNA synthetase|nr:glutamine--tRNA ligase/YqeY domain fusion protein [Thermoguttaceae bacterium]
MSEENLNEAKETKDFIRKIVEDDLASGKHKQTITRFPPEPNGYLHLGHAKSICLNFGIKQEYGGRCNLRFDDTNPTKEDVEYVDSIMDDIHWLGFDWDELHYASDYFDQLYEWAEKLILDGKAYVDELTPEQMKEYRGTLTEPGKPSPYRDRPIEENLDLFRRMKAGEFENGRYTLRAKIDLNSPNINMRDPIMYRIIHQSHHRTGDKWCIYPMYDFTHGQSDSIEGITHSLCTLEFENHRPLYDWYCENLGIYHPRQIEFARLNLTNTVMSKRKLLQLVQEGLVSGWDDPRMPTICGIRRRGYTPEAIKLFCQKIGMNKMESLVEMGLLEHCVREHLNKVAPRVMAVLNPLKVTISNWEEGKVEYLEAINNPEDESAGTRQVPMSRTIYIEKTDFMEEPVKGYFRLAPGKEVRLRWAYYLKCEDFVKDENGEVVELICTYDPETKGGQSPDGRKVKGTIHWVDAASAIDAEVRLYDKLLLCQSLSDVEGDWLEQLNPDSLKVLTGCKVEPALATVQPGYRCQFERTGYFCCDPDSTPEKLVFNRTVSLKDSWKPAKGN